MMRRPTLAVMVGLAIVGLMAAAIARGTTGRSPRRGSQSEAQRRARVHAAAAITVQSSEAEPFDRAARPELVELALREAFRGDMEGESTVRALQILRDDRSARMVSIQRFQGTLGGRAGTFVLQGAEVVENGRIRATWFVVPGSGTGALSGLRGEGGFEGEARTGSHGTLDYWFE